MIGRTILYEDGWGVVLDKAVCGKWGASAKYMVERWDGKIDKVDPQDLLAVLPDGWMPDPSGIYVLLFLMDGKIYGFYFGGKPIMALMGEKSEESPNTTLAELLDKGIPQHAIYDNRTLQPKSPFFTWVIQKAKELL